MKNTITTLLFLMLCSLAFSQDLRYEVRGKYTRGVSKEKLNAANTMSDIRPGYPSTWVNDYISTVISVTGNGKVMKATGVNETLSAEQKSLLQMADVGSEIVVDIGYLYQNSVTGIPDIRNMHFVETVIPEIEAEYPGGYQELIKYLEDNAIHIISELISTQMRPVIISFTVNEKGDISNAQVSASSDDPEIDKLLLKTINKMPKWKPAENALGVKIKQEFEFRVGNDGC